MFFGMLKANRALQFIFMSLAALFFLLTAKELTGNCTLGTATGIHGIICGLSEIYLGRAEVLKNNTKKQYYQSVQSTKETKILRLIFKIIRSKRGLIQACNLFKSQFECVERFISPRVFFLTAIVLPSSQLSIWHFMISHESESMQTEKVKIPE
jgi:hypothetical protein